MSRTRKARARTTRSDAAHSSEVDTPAGDRETSPPADGSTPEDAARPRPDARDSTHDRGLYLIGPTNEATRRLVAESRARQGLTPYINDPFVIEALVLFLRNALDTLDRDERRGPS